jgi:hypothetical protein
VVVELWKETLYRARMGLYHTYDLALEGSLYIGIVISAILYGMLTQSSTAQDVPTKPPVYSSRHLLDDIRTFLLLLEEEYQNHFVPALFL